MVALGDERRMCGAGSQPDARVSCVWSLEVERPPDLTIMKLWSRFGDRKPRGGIAFKRPGIRRG